MAAISDFCSAPLLGRYFY